MVCSLSEAKPKRKVGRPSMRTPRLEKIILGRIAQGRSLRQLCKARRMPRASTIIDWVNTDKEFGERYRKAKEVRAEMLADEIMDIADDSTNDFIETENGKAIDYEHINRSRLRVDSRKWYASKILQKQYGDKTGDIHLNSTVNNIVVLTEQKLQELQERRLLQTQGNLIEDSKV